AETFEGDDLLCPDRRERHHAGAHRLAVEMHGAGAALGEAAAEARAVESQVIAERVEQRHLGIVDRNRDRSTVDIEGNRGGHDPSLVSLEGGTDGNVATPSGLSINSANSAQGCAI